MLRSSLEGEHEMNGISTHVLTSVLDPDITVRRKVIFLLNALLVPGDVVQKDEGDSRMRGEQNSNTPVHPNSHASMTAESTDTSSVTLGALQRHGVVNVIVNLLVHPMPHGEDGDQEGDMDYEEKAVRYGHPQFCAIILLMPSADSCSLISFL